MKPLFHFADLWKCFVRLFKNTDRVNTEDGTTLYMEDNLAIDGNLGVSGDVLIEGSINGEENPSVKPIYYHGIEAYKTPLGNVIYLHILNNSSTPLTSMSQIVSWMQSYQGKIIVQCTGCVIIASTTWNIYSLYKRENESTINMIREGPSGYSIDNDVDLTELFSSSFSDGVNKIN